jgi:hypothetical protein
LPAARAWRRRRCETVANADGSEWKESAARRRCIKERRQADCALT